jgi:hypothetical protein
MAPFKHEPRGQTILMQSGRNPAPCGRLLKEQSTTLLADAVGNNDAPTPTAVLLLVSVLKCFDPLRELLRKMTVVWPNVNAGELPRAIRLHGANEIGKLQLRLDRYYIAHSPFGRIAAALVHKPQLGGPMVIVRTLLRPCSAELLFRLAPTTSMKVLAPCDRQVTTTATPAPSRVPTPPMWGPDVRFTCRPVSVIANLASSIHFSADLALVSEPMWITGACWATACVANAIRVKHNEVRGNPARVILRNMVVSIVLMDGPRVGARMRRIGCSRAETFSSDAHFVVRT